MPAQAEVYVYFNNDWEGYAVENAAYLRDALGATRAAPSDLSR